MLYRIERKIFQRLLQDLGTHIYFSERLKLKKLNVTAFHTALTSFFRHAWLHPGAVVSDLGTGVRGRERCTKEIKWVWAGRNTSAVRRLHLYVTKETLMHRCTHRKGRRWWWSPTLTFHLTAGAQRWGDYGTGPAAAQGVEKDCFYLPGPCHAVRCSPPTPPPSISLKNHQKAHNLLVSLSATMINHINTQPHTCQ